VSAGQTVRKDFHLLAQTAYPSRTITMVVAIN
jgi:hypothetical protein